jgi:hypothetical protein
MDGRGAPPGVHPHAFALATLEDTYEVAAGLNLVRATIACAPEHAGSVASMLWGDAELVTSAVVREVLYELEAAGATEVALISGDAPDLPGLSVGKLFRALGRADIAVCPSLQPGSVALAVRLPLAEWLESVELSLEDPGLLDTLSRHAPRRTAVATTPGWHRLCEPEAIALLDPGLEGWEATRTLLAGGGGQPY